MNVHRSKARRQPIRMSVLTVLLVAGAGLVSIVSPNANAAEECTPYLLIAVRGTNDQLTNERPFGSVLSPVVARVTDDRSDITAVALDYPAEDATSGVTAPSYVAGVAAIGELVGEQTDACPDQRFVLMGWSQGAWVIDGALLENSVPQLVAAVGFGNPDFDPAATRINRGNFGENDPVLSGPESDLGYALAVNDSRFNALSYCDRNDDVCQFEVETDRGTHTEYGDSVDADDAVGFILGSL